uniref:Advanced glycosylation end product-specific receptor variant I n=1 Tax=Canis lupus familiaris TaxID=9615 RepID=B4YB23_CANLF|nr:advanced glycosylation end product-specific receptor variant I [Canis lupus familiaris]
MRGAQPDPICQLPFLPPCSLLSPEQFSPVPHLTKLASTTRASYSDK